MPRLTNFGEAFRPFGSGIYFLSRTNLDTPFARTMMSVTPMITGGGYAKKASSMRKVAWAQPAQYSEEVEPSQF